MLKVEDIHTYYGDSYVLQGITLDVSKGTVVALLGRSGVGKTTLVRSIVGFAPPRQGRILFNGQGPDTTRHADLRPQAGKLVQGVRSEHPLVQSRRWGH